MPSDESRIRDVRKAAALSIEIERTGAAFYRNVAELFSERHRTDLAATFGFLADSELRHQRHFEELIEQAGAEAGDAEEAAATTPTDPHRRPTLRLQAEDFAGDAYLRAIALRLVEEAVYRRLDRIDDPIDVVLRGIDMERSSLLFYQALQERLGAHPVLAEILAEERKHLVTLTAMLEENVFEGF